MSKIKNNKIVVILGPTSSGKTGLAVQLALKFNGEIVSADSRQVYKGMDVGTGKDLAEYEQKITNFKFQISNKSQIFKSQVIKIPHHLIDVVKPSEKFDLAKYQKLAFKAIDGILSRGKLPIVAGGSGLYLQAIIDSYRLSNVGENQKLRKDLEKLSPEQLYKKLLKLNKKFAEKLNNSERNNKRRLIRYVEIQQESQPALASFGLAGKNARKQESKNVKKEYSYLILGLKWPREILRERIYRRLINRLEKENMVDEIKRLHQEGLGWKRLESFGLEYKFISQYLQNKMSYKDMVEKLNIASRQFAKRQMSWFRRWEKQGRKINWLKDQKIAEKKVDNFLKKRPLK
jgi:tRNA dimethylallyltransferase